MIKATASQLMLKPFAANLGRLSKLRDEERALVESIDTSGLRHHNVDKRIVVEGSTVRVPFVIVHGWACRALVLSDGRRQIVSLLLPGDIVGIYTPGQLLEALPIFALTKLRTIEAPALGLASRDASEYPMLHQALHAAVAEEHYFITCHVARLGRQRAYERMAHLLLEIEYKLTTRGLASYGMLSLPLTQEMLGDVLGLSVVHVNRTLQQLRRDKMIELERGRLKLTDPVALRKIAEFRPPPRLAGAAGPATFVSSAPPPSQPALEEVDTFVERGFEANIALNRNASRGASASTSLSK